MDNRFLLGETRKKRNALMRCLCCCCPPDTRPPTRGTSLASPVPEAQAAVQSVFGEALKFKVMDYASGRMYLIGDGSHKAFARFRHVDLGAESNAASVTINVTPEEKPQGISERQWQARYDMFTRYDEGVQVDTTEWDFVIPERIAKHIAKRCKGGVVLDAICGVGECSIQFAKFNPVIALSSNQKAIERASNNASKYQVQHNIQLKHGNFLQLGPHLQADTVFLKLHSYTDLQQSDFPQLLKVAERFRSVALYLPKFAEPAYIASVVSRHTEMQAALDFDLYHLGGHLKGVMCYLGELAVLSRQEMYRVLCSRLRITQDAQTSMLQHYFGALPLKTLLRVLSETESGHISIASEKGRSQLGEMFLDRLSADDECKIDELVSPMPRVVMTPTSGQPVVLRVLGTTQDEILTMILTFCGMPFSIHSVKLDQSEKHNFEVDGFPMMESHGKKLHSTRAIARYLCQTNELYPLDKVEIYNIESLVSFLTSTSEALISAEKHDSIEGYCQNSLPEIFDLLTVRVRDNCGVGGAKPGLGDFYLLEFLWKCGQLEDVSLPESLHEYQQRFCVGSLAKYRLPS